MTLMDDAARATLRKQVGSIRKGSKVYVSALDHVQEAQDRTYSASRGKARTAELGARRAGRDVASMLNDRIESLAQDRAKSLAAEFSRLLKKDVKVPGKMPASKILGVKLEDTVADAAALAEKRARIVIAADGDPSTAFAGMRAHVKTIVRSGTMAAHNTAVLAVARANKSLFDGVMAVATLDLATTDLCLERNGGAWGFDGKALEWSEVDYDFPGRPPWHWNCRTTLVPIPAGEEAPDMEELKTETWLQSEDARAARALELLKGNG